MLLYCLKCKKQTENVNPKFQKLLMKGSFFYENVQCVIVKNQNL